jgi:rare lipoprotein A
MRGKVIIAKISHLKQLIVFCCWLVLLASCGKKNISKTSFNVRQTGKASFYADKFEGRKTASGETYWHQKFTAAHRSLPFGTKVQVRNKANGFVAVVTINDRGPFVAGRIIDVSRAAAKKLDMIRAGVADVEIAY